MPEWVGSGAPFRTSVGLACTQWSLVSLNGKPLGLMVTVDPSPSDLLLLQGLAVPPECD